MLRNPGAEAIQMPPKISQAKLRKFYTLAEARSIRGPFVYGLHDGQKVFYVGKTIDAERRFAGYAPAKSAPIQLLRAIRRAGAALSVVILEHNPPDLAEAEKRHMAARADDLVNQVSCVGRMKALVTKRSADAILRTHLATCPYCDGENYSDGEHKCYVHHLEILTPRANPEMQGILRDMGVIRGE